MSLYKSLLYTEFHFLYFGYWRFSPLWAAWQRGKMSYNHIVLYTYAAIIISLSKIWLFVLEGSSDLWIQGIKFVVRCAWGWKSRRIQRISQFKYSRLEVLHTIVGHLWLWGNTSKLFAPPEIYRRISDSKRCRVYSTQSRRHAQPNTVKLCEYVDISLQSNRFKRKLNFSKSNVQWYFDCLRDVLITASINQTGF